MDDIRISCSGLASIKIDNKYLLMQNSRSRSKGKIIYGPIGGALEYHRSIEPFLNVMEFKPERVTRDLRIHIPIQYIDKFDTWFSKRTDREISNFREMREELVDEEKILESLDINDVTESLMDIVRIQKKSVYFDSQSLYHFEIFHVEFTEDIMDILRLKCKDPNSSIKLFTKEEIIKKTKDITSHSIYIINE